MEEVPRRTSLVPLAFPCFVHCLIGVETEGLLDYQGRAGIISIVRWNLRPVIFGVESSLDPPKQLGWYVCRTKLARKIFSRHEFSHEKCSEFCPEIFEPLFCGSEKIPTKFPPNFPPNFPPQNLKKNHRFFRVSGSVGAPPGHNCIY